MKKYKVRENSLIDIITTKELIALIPVALLVAVWINGGL